jgi:hypothetical protein
VSVALFDLGQRLHAAALRQPVVRSAFAPVLPPTGPVAVMVSGSGEHVLVRASDGTRQTVGTGASALAALAELGISTEGEPRTLVVADRDSLSRLLEVALALDPSSPDSAAAPVVGWWAMRADHPGTGAVLNATAACSARWVLGVAPSDERDLPTWRTWLGVADRGPRGLLEMAALVAAGTTLPGLEAFAEDDRNSWDAFVARVHDPKGAGDWRRRDSRREAALGLASRCDAAELWASLRLGDPLVAAREAFSGTVVTGVVTAVLSRASVEVLLDDLVCRLRENTAVEAFAGYPQNLPPACAPNALVRGRVVSTRVLSGERLIVCIADAIVRAGAAGLGERLTLRPRSVDPRQQRSGRHELHRRYAARRSWLSGGPPLTPCRRDVPLDVVVAAAE